MPIDTLLADLKTEVENTVTVETSAITLINGIAQRIQDAVTAAIAGGATADQLAPVQAEVDSIKASNAALAAAVQANTPSATATPETPAA